MKIQIPYKCKEYKPNDNLNKTCDNKARCKIYYDEVCEEYKENKIKYCDGLDCACCNVVDCKELKNNE